MRRVLAVVAFGLSLIASSPVRGREVVVTDSAGNPVTASVRWDGGGAGGSDAIVMPDDVSPQCVTAPGFVPRRLGALQDGEVLKLQRATAVAGWVVTPDGKRAAGVALRVMGDDALGPCARSATSGADGSFRLDGLLPGVPVRLEVVASDAWLGAPAQVPARPGAAPLALDVVVLAAVHPALTVKGADGKPVAGAAVSVQPRWDRLDVPSALGDDARKAIDDFKGETDAAGRVRLPVLPRAAGWRLVVRHPGHAPASLVADLRQGDGALAITLAAGGTLRVRALDEAGAPRTGVTARLTSSTVKDADLVLPPAPSGADGVLRLDHVPVGRLDAELRAPGARPKLLRGLVIKDGAVTDAGDATLEPGATLRGTVVSDGSPLPGAEVTLWTTADGAKLKLTATSDAAGAFVFEGLDPEATADLEADLDGYTGPRVDDAATGATDVVIDLERTARLVVSVRDAASGAPPGDVEISLGWDSRFGGSADAVQDAEHPDEWTVPSVRAGKRDVLVRAPGYAPETRSDLVVVGGETTRLVVELQAGRVIEGQVVTEETGAPVPLATLSVPGQGVTAASARDGSFTLDGVRAPFDVEARCAGFMPARVTGVDPDKLPEDGLVVTLQRGGAVEGSVLGADGQPLPGAIVSDSEAGISAHADADGHYLLDGLPPGTRTLHKVDRAGTFDGLEGATVDVVKGGVARHDFGAGLRITGVVTHRGEPVRGVKLGVMGVDAGSDPTAGFMTDLGAATSLADGRYTVAVTHPGKYCLNVAWHGRRFARFVTVPEGARAVTEDIAIPDMHLAGRVIDAATREPLKGATVSLYSKTAEQGGSSSRMMSQTDPEGHEDLVTFWSSVSSEAQSDADGSFSVLVDRPGPSSLSAWLQNYDLWKGPDDFSVSESRDDLVIEMVPTPQRRDLKVRLVDGATGAPVTGTIVAMTTGGRGSTVNIMSDTTTGKTAAPMEGQTAIVLAWSAGRGMAVRDGIAPADDDIDITMPLSPGGSVRVLVPEGVLTPQPMRGLTGPLSVKIPPGLEIAADAINIRMNVTSKLVAQEGAGAWIFRDLPVGPVTFALGDGTPKTVDVVAGEIAEADLR